MPLGLWKSRWEIHHEDMERHWAEMDRRHAEYREEIREDRASSEAESRDLRGRSDELREETRDLRADYDREVAEARLFNRELLIRMEKTYATMGSTMGLVGDELVAVREELHELKAAVDAQTEAILKLVDRFEDTDGRPPV